MSKNKHSRKKKHHGHRGHHERKNKNPHLQFVQGTISITSKGDGYFMSPDIPEDIKIPEYELNTAMNGDTVEVSFMYKKHGEKLRGRIEKIIKRKKTEIVGTITKKDNFLSFVPDDKKIYREVIVLKNRKSERVNNNDKVLLSLNPWVDPEKNPTGEIVKILGQKGVNDVEMESILYEKGFSPGFSASLEKEAEKIKQKAPADFEQEMQKRFSADNPPPSGWDFRNTTTFTIDPYDAKDFDDALSFRDLGDGSYEVGVHIADVTHYVTEGSLIDQEAIRRGTSVYLVDRTIPMLPEVLSNDLCSLNPNEDKLTFSAIFIVNDKCEVQKKWFGETVINSDKRFTYKEAQEILDKGEGLFYKELNKLNELALLKRKRRTKNGAVNFVSDEVKFDLDSRGHPVAVHRKETLETNELIEDFMLLANREVAQYVAELNKKTGKEHPFVYRIHDQPKPEKIIELENYLKTIGFTLEEDNGKVTSQAINKLLDEIEGIDEETLIEKAVLRSMAKAIYSTNNIGHFGLAFKYYTHFTSPIRRYPDMMVHRLLKKYLKGIDVPQDDLAKYSHLCQTSSQQEVLAMDAERDSDKRKYAEYMSDRIGEEFDGMIASVADWGVYVQDINTKAEGLVRMKTLKGDYFTVDPKHYRVVGEKTGKVYTIGDHVRIKLIGVDIDRGTIDFEIVSS